MQRSSHPTSPSSSAKTSSYSMDIIIPSEIQSIIFEYLPLADRKSVRLTCRSFYNACNRVRIIEKERFVISAKSTQRIDKTLISCLYQRLNLFFRNLRTSMSTLNIWKHCGYRIYHLSMMDCRLNWMEFACLIDRCTNLRSWRFAQDNRSLNPLHTALEYLLEKQVTRDKLVSFELTVHSRTPFCGATAEKILLVFSKLESFVICSPEFYIRDISYYRADPSRNGPCLVDTKFEKYINVDVIRELVFDMPASRNWMESITALPLTRLRKLQTVFWRLDDVPIVQSLIAFFSNNPQLEIVNLTFRYINLDELKEAVLHMFRNCSDLREFRLCYQRFEPLQFSDDEFRALLRLSKLELVDFRFHLTNTNMLDYKWGEFPLDRAQRFIIHHGCTENEHVAILKLFRNLQCLTLFTPTDKVLQAIFRYQAKLLRLNLYDIDECTDYGFTGKNPRDNDHYSIKALQDLEQLTIETSRWHLSGDIFLEFVFPKLRFLSIALEYTAHRILPQHLKFVARNASLLLRGKFRALLPRYQSKVLLAELVEILPYVHYLSFEYYVNDTRTGDVTTAEFSYVRDFEKELIQDEI